jgi:uncharacterized protein YecE (DUF72 family)
MNSAEINGSFYSLQTPASYQKWREATPEDFLFAVKGSKFITHNKKLMNARIPLANFFASGVLALGNKLGPILWQFAPWFRFDIKIMEEFLDQLPGTTSEAAHLSGENTIADITRTFTDSAAKTELRYAFEPRHDSFFTEEFVELLRSRNHALAIADTGGKWTFCEDVTADFVYIRLHGKELYQSGYTDNELQDWAARIKTWQHGGEPADVKRIGKKARRRKRDVYVYFDNSMAGHAPLDAIRLAQRLTSRNEEE